MTNKKIPATIGILTYNSADTLKRALESVKDFQEIVIADGGSEDDTINIARKFGCKIIEQSDPGKRITDFALERNRTLDATTTNWFFYLDSDEIMSEELRDEIAAISRKENPEHMVYEVPYQLTDSEGERHYETLRQYYQPRLFNTTIGARFKRRAHERVSFDISKYSSGRVRGKWYVPMDVQLSFKVYRSKLRERIPQMAQQWVESGCKRPMKKIVWRPIREISKTIARVGLLRLRYPAHRLVPFRYECYRLYSHVYSAVIFTRLWAGQCWRPRQTHVK